MLVNLAGIRAYEPLAEAKRETWETLIKVNLLSYAYLIRASLEPLRARGAEASSMSPPRTPSIRAPEWGNTT